MVRAQRALIHRPGTPRRSVDDSLLSGAQRLRLEALFEADIVVGAMSVLCCFDAFVWCMPEKGFEGSNFEGRTTLSVVIVITIARGIAGDVYGKQSWDGVSV